MTAVSPPGASTRSSATHVGFATATLTQSQARRGPAATAPPAPVRTESGPRAARPGSRRPTGVVGPRSLTALAAALPVAAIAMPLSVPVTFEGKTFTFTAVQVAVAVLAAHLTVSVVGARHGLLRSPGRPAWTVALVLASMAPAVLVAPDVMAAVGAYVNFFFGLVGGALVGVVWRRVDRGRRGWIEDGLVAFLLLGSLQLFSSLSGSRAASAFHESAQTSWGSSNYVALTLVIAALALVGHGRATGSLRWFDVVAATAGLAGAGLTYSRGGILAAGVGVAVLCWSWPRPGWRRVSMRALTLLLPLAVLWLLNAVVAMRALENAQVYRNVDLRIALYRLAAEEFTTHPLLGSGWLALRSAAQVAFGYESSFAHNLVLSFLQIGGLLGLVPLTFIALRSLAAVRVPGMAAPVLAALTGAMSDPFFEGTVAALLAWACLWFAQGRRAEAPDVHDTLHGPRSRRTWPARTAGTHR